MFGNPLRRRGDDRRLREGFRTRPGSGIQVSRCRRFGLRGALAALFICLGFWPVAPVGAQPGVQVRLGAQALIETAPDSVATLTFAVTNTSDEALEFMDQVALPADWRLVTPALPFRLDPRRTEIRIVSFFIPQTARAGRHEIAYRVHAVKSPAISDTASADVVILATTDLQVQLVDVPESVIAGDVYDARFLVTNAGNTESSVTIQVRSAQDLPFDAAPEAMMLSPGGSSEVRVQVKTDAGRRHGFTHHLEVTAVSKGDETLRGTASCAVKVIPRVTGEVDRFHRIPSRIILRAPAAKGEMESTQLQGEISGEGTLSENGEDEIAFMFRGPDTLAENAVYGDHDRYFAGYRNPWGDLLLGDGYFSLSKLTEQSRDGRGVAGGLALGNAGLRGYAMNTRWLDPEEQTGGLQIDYGRGDRFQFGLNLFTKTSDLQDARIASIQGLATPMNNADITFEAAYGEDEGEGDGAFWFNIFGSPPWGSYRIEYLRAAPDFPGYYQDVEYMSGNFFLPIRKRLNLNLSLRQERSNLDNDPFCTTADLSRYGLAGLNYAFDTGTTVALESRYSTREDRLSPPLYDERDLTLKARLGQRIGRAYVNLSAEMGSTVDHIMDQTTAVAVYEATGYVMPTPNQTYGGYVRYGSHDDPEYPEREVLNAGLTASLQLGADTRLQVRAEMYDDLDNGVSDRQTFDAGIHHVLPNGWIASVQGRHIRYSDRERQADETAIIAEITIPFGLPVGRKKSIGMLAGHVLSQETREPVSNAILRLNGTAAVTDERGEFRFPALKPGTFHLDVDAASIGLDRIPVQKTPMAVDIQGGEETALEIGVTRSADLTGTVMVYEFQGASQAAHAFGAKGQSGADEVVASWGLANALVELSKVGEILRVLTDGKGRFSFNGVRPGAWTLTVQSDKLPQHHYLEKDRFTVDLAQGDRREMSIRVLPQKRVIQIIEGGGAVIEE